MWSTPQSWSDQCSAKSWPVSEGIFELGGYHVRRPGGSSLEHSSLYLLVTHGAGKTALSILSTQATTIFESAHDGIMP